MGILGLLLAPVCTFSIFRTIKNLSKTRPKATGFLPKKSHLAKKIKTGNS